MNKGNGLRLIGIILVLIITEVVFLIAVYSETISDEQYKQMQRQNIHKRADGSYYYQEGNLRAVDINWDTTQKAWVYAKPEPYSYERINDVMTPVKFHPAGTRVGFLLPGVLGPSPGDTSCFLSSTPITLSNLETKQISEIKSNDPVLSFDLENNNLVISKVLNVFSHLDYNYLVINGNMKVTPYHVVYAKRII